MNRSTEVENLEKPKILHFEPTINGRDRFGNRIFTSQTYSYTDRENQLVKGGLLVSEIGLLFLKNNPQFLKIISAFLDTADEQSDPERIIAINENCKARFLAKGGQSLVFMIEIGNSKYILKTERAKKESEKFNPSQPYINEMLQSQSVSEDLKHELKELGIEMPEFLFATGQMSFIKYAEGETLQNEDNIFLSDKINKLGEVVQKYIQDRLNEGVTLWNNIRIDIRKWHNSSINLENFIKKKDGTVVWIDPFYYLEKTERVSSIIIRNRKILLIHRVFEDTDYWNFPGGVIDKEDTVEETAKRELYSNTHLEIQSCNKIFEDYDNWSNCTNHFTVCEVTSPETFSSKIIKQDSKDVSFFEEAEWVELDQISKIKIVPATAKSKLLDFISSLAVS